MNVIICDGVAVSYGADEILHNVSFSVNAGDKVGIIGVNGAGKSTLFSVINGSLEPSGGNVFIANGTRIGMLEQINDAHRFNCSIIEEALSAFSDLLKLETEIESLRLRMEDGDESAIKAFTAENERFIRNGGNEFRSKTRSMLARFGFLPDEFDRNADSLSGGQKTKLLLVKLLLSEPDVILLDEPTNHLDADACEWLEGFISTSRKTFLIISHDRYFLDKVTNHTLEIRKGLSEMFSGNYSVFREKRKALEEAQLKHYNLQQKEIARLEAFIEQQRRWNREKNIKAAESRQKTIDKMVKLDKPVEREKSISFSITGSGAMANDVLSVRGISMSYPANPLFDNLSFELRHGDRMFVYGANGCGKSTLLKIITGRETQKSGVFELGYNQTIGYYDQEQQLLEQKNTVLDELWSVYSDKSGTEIRSMLARFGFYGDDVFKSVSVLSGGERARLSIAKMISGGVSLLVLDEPTNHLDIESREMLEDALDSYDGTLLAVSHDRYFIRRLATRVLEIDRDGYEGGYSVFDCDYDTFMSRRYKKSPPKVATSAPSSGSKRDYEESKQRKNRLRTAKARYSAVEKEIAELETKLSEVKKESEDESNASNYEKLNRLYTLKEEHENRINELFDELLSLENEISELGE